MCGASREGVLVLPPCCRSLEAVAEVHVRVSADDHALVEISARVAVEVLNHDVNGYKGRGRVRVSTMSM